MRKDVSKVQTVKFPKKIIKKPKISLTEVVETDRTSCENSFLQETTFNSNVDMELRQEIEKKFKKSRVNSKYVFPRNVQIEKKKKKLLIKQRNNSKQTLSMEKSLPIIHKMTKSNYDSTDLLSNLISLQKMHRVSSSIKTLRDTKLKGNKSRNTPTQKPYSRTLSQNNRANTPSNVRKETSVESKQSLDRTKKILSKKKNIENNAARPKSVLKNPAHLYTSSMGSVIPSAIIKTVSYY